MFSAEYVEYLNGDTLVPALVLKTYETENAKGEKSEVSDLFLFIANPTIVTGVSRGSGKHQLYTGEVDENGKPVKGDETPKMSTVSQPSSFSSPKVPNKGSEGKS